MTDDELFATAEDVATTADLRIVDGVAKVSAERTDHGVRITIPLSAGEATAELGPKAARELGEALIEGADTHAELEEAEE
jgi:hypothetical protein